MQGGQEGASARYNRQLALNNAQMAQAAAAQRAQAIRSSGERVTSEGIATIGASGVDVNTGSPLIYQLDQIAKTDISARQALYEGAVKATGYGATATEYGDIAALRQPSEPGRLCLPEPRRQPGLPPRAV
jgi:hypothetical protein